ncbi:MAG: hypothetical protein ABL907_16470 [Hyphomicrobium sp.]
MSDLTAAGRLRSSRPMPDLSNRRLALEGAPAVAVGRTKKSRSPARPEIINTSLTTRHYQLLEELTAGLRRSHGRGWRHNDTLELALETLARDLPAR